MKSKVGCMGEFDLRDELTKEASRDRRIVENE